VKNIQLRAQSSTTHSLSRGAVILQMIAVMSIYFAHLSSYIALIGQRNPDFTSCNCRKYAPKNMILTQINPYIFGISFVIKYDVTRRKGIVRALSGQTSDRSPYFTDLRAVIVAIAPRTEEQNNISSIFPDIVGIPIYRAIGKRTIKESKRVPSDREYSSIDEIFFSSVNIFPAISHSDLRNATMSASMIQIIVYLPIEIYSKSYSSSILLSQIFLPSIMSFPFICFLIFLKSAARNSSHSVRSISTSAQARAS
jgi:hypothetical protein